MNLKAYDQNTENTEDTIGSGLDSEIIFNCQFDNYDGADGWDSDWMFYLTTVDENNIESALGDRIEYLNNSQAFENTDVTKCPQLDVFLSESDSNLNNKKFIKVYATSERNSSHTLQAVIDCNKRTIKSSSSETEIPSTLAGYLVRFTLPREQMLIPNEIDTYESETGVLIENALNPNKMIATFKTSVIANNTLYAGNVYQDGVHYPDRMLKSPIGKAPLLPSTNFIDVAINDGDDIVSIKFYKDKLLQFKRNKLYIINTSEDYDRELYERFYTGKPKTATAPGGLQEEEEVLIEDFLLKRPTGPRK